MSSATVADWIFAAFSLLGIILGIILIFIKVDDSQKFIISRAKMGVLVFFLALLCLGIVIIRSGHEIAFDTHIITPKSKIKFEDYISYLQDGKIKYSSPGYGIEVILPDKCLCQSYLPASQKSPEEIELLYDSDLKIDISINEMPYKGFNSLEEYGQYYLEIYKESPNFYKSFNFEKSIPYCVFSFNSNDGKGIYYELTYDVNGVYCATEFNYPIEKRNVYDIVVSDYVEDSVFDK